jgi:hypothetical protein
MSHRVSERQNQSGRRNVLRGVSRARRVPDQRAPDALGLLERVEERDRAILSMLQERIHPDDIAATLGISGAALRRRRARINARLRSSHSPRPKLV